MVEFSRESSAISRRGAFPAEDTIIPPRDAIKSHTTIPANVNRLRFEPSVFVAVGRHRVLVLTMAILGMVLAAAYSLHQPKIYQAEANVTVPLPVSLQSSAGPGQYFDSQVLLLESEGVAQQAANIASRELGTNLIGVQDFYGNHSKLVISPPTTATPGGYGATIVAVSFKGSSPEIAQVGLNAVIQAFDNALSDAIKAQANATVAGINKTINQSKSPAQQAALETQRTQVLVNEQSDLAQTPTAAVEPATRANGKWALNGAIGLVAGLLVGVALAYTLAVRTRKIANPQDPAVIYDVPMIAEIPAFKGKSDVPVADDPNSAAAEAFRFAAVSVERIHAARGAPLSLALVSPVERADKSTLVANLALAIAEGGTRLLVVDADPADDGLAAKLLPGIQMSDGFEQVLSGRRAAAECLKRSPFNDAITVLGSSPSTPRLVTGAARLKAARVLLAQARKTFDIVLIDCPALLQVADATELVNAADVAIIVVDSDDRIPDHLEMADWLTRGSSDVIGYFYNRAQMRSSGARRMRGGSVARPVVSQARPDLAGARSWGDSRQQSHQRQR
ncbi:MAG: AAA family ATPase [Streptosporangiaceae bacterium]